MADDDTPPDADRLDGMPHPRETAQVFGHEIAKTTFLDTWRQGRLHHAWLLRGPRGVGKATLAYRLARAVLVHGDAAPATLDVDPAHPVSRHINAGAEPRLFTLRREWDRKAKRHGTVITAEAARTMERRLFQLTAADGGWRVAIIDSMDELQMPAAANALLKIIEEPPPRCLLLLLTAQPGRLLPTIRSRCRTLDLHPLAPDALGAAVAQAQAAAGADGSEATPEVLTALAGGSPGEALAMADLGAPGLYAELSALLAACPGLPRPKLLAIARKLAAREQQPRFALVLALTVLMLRRLARAGVGAPLPPLPGEEAIAERLCPDLRTAQAWAAMAAEIEANGAHARAVNLDPVNTILDIWLGIDAAAARGGAAPV